MVAALNIANTMMMSIYERTKEIGVMKVLGCEIRKIRNMFLMEAGAIGLLGGVIGVALSYGASYVLNNINTIMAFFGKGEGVDLSGIMGGMGSMMGMGETPPSRSSRPGWCCWGWAFRPWWGFCPAMARPPCHQDQRPGGHSARIRQNCVLFSGVSPPRRGDTPSFISYTCPRTTGKGDGHGTLD